VYYTSVSFIFVFRVYGAVLHNFGMQTKRGKLFPFEHSLLSVAQCVLFCMKLHGKDILSSLNAWKTFTGLHAKWDVAKDRTIGGKGLI